MKNCTKCNIEKEDSYFSVRVSGRLASWCKQCTGEHIELYRKNNQEYSDRKNDLSKQRRVTLRRFIWNYFKLNPCLDCGESDPIVLDFDHRGNKSFNISDAVSKGCSLELLISEISKCDIRCSNCHRRKTAKERGFYKDLTA